MLTWLIVILAALLLYLAPARYVAGGDPSDLTTDPPPTVTFIGDDGSDP